MIRKVVSTAFNSLRVIIPPHMLNDKLPTVNFGVCARLLSSKSRSLDDTAATPEKKTEEYTIKEMNEIVLKDEESVKVNSYS